MYMHTGDGTSVQVLPPRARFWRTQSFLHSPIGYLSVIFLNALLTPSIGRMPANGPSTKGLQPVVLLLRGYILNLPFHLLATLPRPSLIPSPSVVAPSLLFLPHPASMFDARGHYGDHAQQLRGTAASLWAVGRVHRGTETWVPSAGMGYYPAGQKSAATFTNCGCRAESYVNRAMIVEQVKQWERISRPRQLRPSARMHICNIPRRSGHFQVLYCLRTWCLFPGLKPVQEPSELPRLTSTAKRTTVEGLNSWGTQSICLTSTSCVYRRSKSNTVFSEFLSTSNFTTLLRFFADPEHPDFVSLPVPPPTNPKTSSLPPPPHHSPSCVTQSNGYSIQCRSTIQRSYRTR
ncbi:hypothetical protein C8R47DRAFT_710649 [Mycena vitilis]|nr:hypothetical protein C8R47DRAFT_710649 [Mycena vitilis]